MPIQPTIALGIQVPEPIDIGGAQDRAYRRTIQQQNVRENAQQIAQRDRIARNAERDLAGEALESELLALHTVPGEGGRPKINYMAVQKGLNEKGYGKLALALEGKRVADRKLELEAEDKDLEAGLKRAARFASLAGSVTDQASMDRAIGTALSEGIIDRDQAGKLMAQQWSPEMQAQMAQIQQQGMTATQQLEAARAQRKAEYDQIKGKLEAEQAQAEAAERKGDAEGLTKAERAKLTPTSKREYDIAVKGGYKGSFNQWLTEDANRKATRVAVNNVEQKQFENERALAKEFAALPVVKAANEVKTQVARAEGAYKQFLEKGGSANSTDQIIVTVLNKVLDPTSVVREGEYARTAEGQAVLSRLEGYLSRMTKGGAGLSGSERESVMSSIRQLGGDMDAQYQPVAKKYGSMAKGYGLRPENVVTDAGGSGGNAGPARPKSKAEYDALPSGAVYIDPKGEERTKK